MTANSKMTEDECDKYVGQHSFGKLEYEYALCPHEGDWKQAELLAKAYAHKVPLKAVQGVAMDGELPDTASFITVNHEKKVFVSAIKQAENGDGVIVRLWNSTGENLDLTVSTILPVKAVERIRLDETHVSDTNFDGKKLTLKLGAHKIETLRLKF